MLQTVVETEVILKHPYSFYTKTYWDGRTKQVKEEDTTQCEVTYGTPTRYNLNQIVKVVPEEHIYNNWGYEITFYRHYFSNGEEILFDKDLLDIKNHLE